MADEPASKLFQALDTNNDGRLSIDELPAPLRVAFERMDTNGDGFISPEEEAAARQAAGTPTLPPRARHFVATLSLRGKSVAVPIPFDPNAVWGTRERHDVRGSIDGHFIRGPLQTDREGYVLVLGPKWREDNALELTHEVDVILAPEGPLVEELADDIATALKASPDARAFFESLPTFNRKNFVRWIEDAKRPETRAKRIAEALVQLQNKQRR